MDTLLFRQDERVAVVTINRPDKLNALNGRTKAELRDLIGRLDADPAVGAVIVTGAGEKSFVAGTDIAELVDLARESGEQFARGGQDVFDRIERMQKPVIAAVNGYALGGGCELALACHLRFASERARFGQPEVNLGILPGYGGTQRLTRLVGRGKALEMILGGVPIDAQEALRIGLVNAVLPPEELLPHVQQVAKTLAEHPAVALKLALRAVLAAGELEPADGMRREAELFGECCTSADFREGVAAFLAKRKPVFTHR